jgi:hypothetical protein
MVVVLFIGACFFPNIIGTSNQDKRDSIKNEDSLNINNEGTEYWALLVAVGVYADNPGENRPLMLKEVDNLYETLIDSPQWSKDHIKVIKGEDATVLNIIKGLRWLDRMEDDDDFSLVFITTHGYFIDNDYPPKDEADGKDEILISYWGFAYLKLYIWDDELNFLLNRLESQGVCLIVDSCHAGGFNDPPDWNKTSINNEDEEMSSVEWIEGFADDVRGQGRVVLMASREDEVAYSGGFAPYLIDGLRGFADVNDDYVVTAEELFYYAEPRAIRQHPTIYDGYEGDLPLIYLTESVKKNKNFINQQKIVTINEIGKSDSIGFSPENSIIKGYIKDINTNNPIKDAIISIRGRDDDGDFFENETTSGTDGFYSFNVPPCRCWMIVNVDGYCSDYSNFLKVEENEMLWVNFSLYPRPPENSVLCGYIKDNETGDPVEGAEIELFWEGDIEQFYLNETFSDHNGFYSIDVAAGEIDLEVDAIGYFRVHLDNIIIADFETLWANFSLQSLPPESAVVCGYISDKNSSAPINNARIIFEWNNITTDKSYENETFTDSSGFYYINIAPGELYHDIRKSGHDYYNPYRIDAIENEIQWFNITLEENIVEIDIAKPLRAFYINNKRVIPYTRARIIGNIDIEAYVHEDWWGGGSADKVEIYVDGELKASFTEEPYVWSWTEKTFGKHIIKVVAYDDEGKSYFKEIEVYKIL